MKKLNRKFIKGTNWALAGVMSLLGISSCDKETFGSGGMAAYGTPHAEFVVSGKVTDTEGNALSGVRVVVPSVEHRQKATQSFIPDKPVFIYEVRDTLYTKSNGSFEYSYAGFPTNDSINVKMKFEDTRFETDSTKVSFFDSDLKGGSGWNRGSAKKEVTIKLKRKESE